MSKSATKSVQEKPGIQRAFTQSFCNMNSIMNGKHFYIKKKEEPNKSISRVGIEEHIHDIMVNRQNNIYLKTHSLQISTKIN